jgi:hypothetical protein
MRSTPYLIAGAGAAVLLLSGCGTDKVDTDQLEHDLAKHSALQAGVDVGQIKVDCPGDQEAKKGTTFNCTMTAGGRKLTVEVKLTSKDHYQAVPEK